MSSLCKLTNWLSVLVVKCCNIFVIKKKLSSVKLLVNKCLSMNSLVGQFYVIECLLVICKLMKRSELQEILSGFGLCGRLSPWPKSIFFWVKALKILDRSPKSVISPWILLLEGTFFQTAAVLNDDLRNDLKEETLACRCTKENINSIFFFICS